MWDNIQPLLELLARGGGGGSGGGGGGGGGGGSGGGSGGDGGGGIIVLLGYIPTHFYGALLRKKMQNPVGMTLMIVGTLAYGLAWWFLGAWGILISLGAFLGGPAGYYGWFGKVSSVIRKSAKKEITAAASKDPAWDITTLTTMATNTFMAYQADWSSFNIERIKTYTTPSYGYYAHLMLAAIYQRGRKNLVDEPRLIEAFPIDVEDSDDNSHDKVTFYMHGQAKDRIIETIDGQDKELFVDKNEFYERWTFVRNGNNWLLDDIKQYSESVFLKSNEIRTFATKNSLCYSADWGWLLLPRRGQLFKGGQFGKSDINNHTIGMYKNLLIELYTYIPNYSSDNQKQIVIAQVALPKRYDSLVVEAKGSKFGSLFSRTPKGYNKLSLEWPDFNRRYDVYATDVEQVTAFELLHPVYMEKLFALPFKVSIEVVDNVVYLYSRDKKAEYESMYSILKDAFEEMKL